MRRSNPEAWLALLARDYRTRTPRPEELREETIRRLQAHFTEQLQTESKDEELLAGHRAQRMVFRGDADQVVMSGECCTFAHQGIAYWVILWAPVHDTQAAQVEFPSLRQRLTLLNESRPGWTDRPVTRTFEGHRVRCTVQDEDGLWSEWTPAKDYDPAADLALYVKDEGQGKGGEKAGQVAATVLLLELKSAPDLDDAVRAARAHLQDQQKPLGLPTAIEPVVEKDASPAPVGFLEKGKGRLVRLQVQIGETQQRFVVQGVVRQTERVLVLQGECDARRRAEWEPRFLRLMNGFQLQEP
jgi:hypothetical protein